MTSRTINGMIKFQKSLNGMGLLSEVLYAGNNLADVNSHDIPVINYYRMNNDVVRFKGVITKKEEFMEWMDVMTGSNRRREEL